MTEKRKLTKYEEYANEANREKGVNDISAENAEIIRDELEGMISNFKSDVTRTKREVKNAEKAMTIAYGLLTDSAEEWIANVRRAEETVKNKKKTLADINNTIDDLEEKLKLFK